MVKEYETKNLWAIFPPPIASIMQFTAEFIQQKRICLRALWYFFPQHICINWCLLLTFRIGLYTEDLVIALFIGGKKRYNTLRPDSSRVPLRILLNLQWEQTATACRPQKQGNHSPQPLYAARQDSRTHKDSKRNVHEYTHTHKFIIYIHTHAKPAESADDGAHKFSFSKFRMQVSMYVYVLGHVWIRICHGKRLCLLPLQTRSVESGPQTTNQSETCSTFEADAHWGEASWLHSNERPPLIPF